MVELRPYPFGALVRRMLREAREKSSIFDLPLEKCFFGGENTPDLSVDFSGSMCAQPSGQTAGTPLGPAAGPQSQMAQNLVLAWLVGCRVMELKTVQVLDQLEIPRPCIDMATVGFNVEWSQELSLSESLEEYIKGSMLIDILRVSGEVPMSVEAGASLGDVIFDMSVGYDLAGVKSNAVQAFIRGMQNASEIVARLRAELLSDEFADLLLDYPALADLEFASCISNTLTLSTFHGCPSDEIENICAFLMRENGLDVIVKLNPTLLGPERVRELLEEELNYHDLVVPPKAFDRDMKWDEMIAFVARSGDLASDLNRCFGVKFSNTLIVENRRDFFPGSESEVYLSGAPLHVLAIELVARFRAVFGERFPISFSAGIDRSNFADAVALGLVPVTVCTDLLRPGGYARAAKYLFNLEQRMAEVNATSIGDFVLRAFGCAQEGLMNAWVSSGAADFEALGRCEAAICSGSDLRMAAGSNLYFAWVREVARLNTSVYALRVISDSRYGAAKNSREPKKIGKHLDLFDCTTCDKCVPVCPNNANFSFVLPALDVPILKVRSTAGGFAFEDAGRLVVAKQKQYANFADFCNECGNCDVFCPEDGGPYVVKPRFFRTRTDWEFFKDHDGFVFDDHVCEGDNKQAILGRFDGQVYSLSLAKMGVCFTGPRFKLELDPEAPLETTKGWVDQAAFADLTYLYILSWVRDAVFGAEAPNYLNMTGTGSGC